MKRSILVLAISVAAILTLACGTSALPTPIPPTVVPETQPAPSTPPTPVSTPADTSTESPTTTPLPTQSPNEPTLDDLQRELNQNRELWESNGVADYQFVYQKICFCAPPDVAPVTVSVSQGTIVAVTLVDSGLSVTEADLERYSTIEDLFDLIQDAIDRDAYKISVEYDADLGYPLEANIDYDSRMADEEQGFKASGLEPIANRQ